MSFLKYKLGLNKVDLNFQKVLIFIHASLYLLHYLMALHMLFYFHLVILRGVKSYFNVVIFLASYFQHEF